MKAIDQRITIDRRRIRAQMLTAQILHIVGRHLSDEDHRNKALREIAYELQEALERAGVEILTDDDRRAAGLPERGPEGWTIEELIILEEKRLEVMRRPIFINAQS